ncbi:MAG: family 78 glycoside hydrolase catalytic domain, partial [Candidatus Firestonebacteria bacterium]
MGNLSQTCNLRCEFLENPLGIEETKPRLSWQLKDERKGARQTAFQIVAASSPSILKAQPDLWNSGRVSSSECLDIVYSGKALTSRKVVFWSVRTWDKEGSPSAWSDMASFEMGLLKAADWKAKWIGRRMKKTAASRPAPFLRRSFTLKENIAKARIYVTSRGIFELHLNGEKVGQDYFTPGWTDYNKRLQYLVYDVTAQLTGGTNVLGAMLGDGWYAGFFGWNRVNYLYGDQLSLLLQLEVEYCDGSREVICSDPAWKTALGPILKSDIYNGEKYDARKELPNWDNSKGKDSFWKKASVFSAPRAILTAKCSGPVRKQEEMPVIKQTEPVKGVHIFDLGQNMAGRARLILRGKSGTGVKIRYGEMLNDDGTLYT